MGKACSTLGEHECVHGTVGKSRGKKQLGLPRCRW
jgi:hypothetical protein